MRGSVANLGTGRKQDGTPQPPHEFVNITAHSHNALLPQSGLGFASDPTGNIRRRHLRTIRTRPIQLRRGEREIQGVIMSKKSCAVLTAVLLCAGLPAIGQQLPDGPGKELAEASCNSCHTLLSRVGSGYTENGWKTVLRMMVNQGVELPADQIEPLREYLTRSFPEKGKPDGVVIPGPAEVSFQNWQVPTPGSRPHDPLATKDGSLWYTGQLANVLGRLDPATGKFTEFQLKTPHSGPHGLQEDRDGNIWYTGNTGSLIGKLDPKTGAVT